MSFADFWWKTVTVGPWPSGPIWFLWVLLTFDVVAAVLYRLSPGLLDPINRLALRGHDYPAAILRRYACCHRHALRSRARMLGSTSSWFEFGPFSVQHGRVLLYATYFFFGAGIGAEMPGSRAAGY